MVRCSSFVWFLGPLLACLCLVAIPTSTAYGAAAKGVSYLTLSDELQKLGESKKKYDVKQWQQLELKYEEYIKVTKDEANKGLARFDYAQCRELMGNKSKSKADYSAAAKRYERFTVFYPNHRLAPLALLRQASITGENLGDAKTGIALAEKLIQKYPKNAQAEAAKQLIKSLRASSSSSFSNADKAAFVELSAITWKGSAEQGQVSIQLSKSVKYTYQLVAANPVKKEPSKIYIDLPGTKLAAKAQKKVSFSNSPVQRALVEDTAKGIQVVLEVKNVRSYSVAPSVGNKATLEVDVSTKVFRNAAVTASTQRTASGGATLAEQLGLSVKTIMLDAGHGGKDPGAMGNGIVEEDFTLKMAKKIGALLTKNGFTVLYTRSTDTYLALQERPDLANAKKADLFISIHANASQDAAVHGLETYYLDVAQTHAAEKVAARENSVTVKNMSDLQFILSDFMLSSKLEESRDLAKLVHKSILAQVKRAKFSISDSGVRSAPFHVLMGAKMPAVLIEFGYLSHAAEAKNLQSDKFLDQQAQGVVNGIVAYRDKLAKFATASGNKKKANKQDAATKTPAKKKKPAAKTTAKPAKKAATSKP